MQSSAISTVKTMNGKVFCKTAEGSIINIDITQRSALDCMLDAAKAIRMKKITTNSNPAQGTIGSALTLGLGVSFISVGLLCVALAILLAVAGPRLFIVYVGTHFWVGFPLIVSGILNVLAYRYPSPFWMVMAFISLMSSLAVSIAGLVFTANDIDLFRWSNYECNAFVRYLEGMQEHYDSYYRSYSDFYNMTGPPKYMSRRDYSQELSDCNWALTEYKIVQFGLVIVSLLIMIWGICSSAVALGYRLFAVISACKCENPEVEDNDDPLISPNPPFGTDDIIIA